MDYVWYHMQLILNDGQGKQVNSNPIDYGYTTGGVRGLSMSSGNSPEAMLLVMWSVKGLQEETLSGVGPQAGQYGWVPAWTTPEVLVDWNWDIVWSATSAATRATLLQAYTAAWFAQASQYTPQQYYQGRWASATVNPATLFFETTFGGQIWFSLPRLRYDGVDPTLIRQVSDWAATIWPNANWTLENSATCTNDIVCTSGY